MRMCMPQILTMQRTRRRIVLRILLALGLSLAAAIGLLVAVGWPASTRTSRGTAPGHASTMAALEAVIDEPGPITVETVVGAHWSVDRGGVIDLGDPRAAGLGSGLEPIEVDFHALRHPRRGTFLVDTGVERALFDAPDEAAIRGLVASAGGIDRMERVVDTAGWLARQPAPPAAVLLTHLHLDHVAGLRDVPAEVPVLLSAGDLENRAALDLLTQPSIDRALGEHPISEWTFDENGVIDVLDDGTLWALAVPGHTRGSVAFVARTPDGAVLFTGDVSHTAWGWSHDVAPGDYTEDHAQNVASLELLRALASRHPGMQIRLGHQPFHAD
jgi:glyoxylase-like metal-dependent hydrolase (beta-lactamase superfamily II)